MDDLIPQRAPFVLVDKLISNTEELTICSFTVPDEHPLVNEGKLSEGGLTENIAQTASAGNGYQAKEKGIDVPKGFIASIKKLKIYKLPLSGDILTTKVWKENRVMEFNLIRGEVYKNDELLASCEMKIYCPE